MTSPTPTPARLPLPLAVAGVVAAIEGLALVIYGLVQIPAISGSRLVMGTTDAAFFLAYGGFLVLAGFKLTRRQSWAWAPIMLAQLLQVAVGLTWGNTVVAIVLLVPGVIAAVALLLPPSIRSLLDNLTGRWTVEDSPDTTSGSPDEPSPPNA